MVTVDYLINGYNDKEKIDVRNIVYLDKNFLKTLNGNILLEYRNFKNIDLKLIDVNLKNIIEFIKKYKNLKNEYDNTINSLKEKYKNLDIKTDEFFKTITKNYNELSILLSHLENKINNSDNELENFEKEVTNKINNLKTKLENFNNPFELELEDIKYSKIDKKEIIKNLKKNNIENNLVIINGKDNSKFSDNFTIFKNHKLVKFTNKVEIRNLEFYSEDKVFDILSFGENPIKNNLIYSIRICDNELVIGDPKKCGLNGEIKYEFDLDIKKENCNKLSLIKNDKVENFNGKITYVDNCIKV